MPLPTNIFDRKYKSAGKFLNIGQVCHLAHDQSLFYSLHRSHVGYVLFPKIKMQIFLAFGWTKISSDEEMVVKIKGNKSEKKFDDEFETSSTGF